MRKFTLIYLLFFSLQLTAQHRTEAISFAQEGFVENKGQVIDQYGKTNSYVRFIYAGSDFNLQLKNNGFSYELFEVVMNPESHAYEFDASLKSIPAKPKKTLRSHRVDITVIGGNLNAEIRSEPSTGTVYNFYTSNTGEYGITGVNSYKNITYKNIYPGIDLKFSATDESHHLLKYEWIIHPGADPAVIRLKYFGVHALSPDLAGGFNISTSKGGINESSIYAYQLEDGVQVKAQYRIMDNVISYQVAGRKDKTVVIDPNITWFSYYGGEGEEDIYESYMGIDANGNPLIVGQTNSLQYIASSGAFQATYGGGVWDAYIAKFKANGKLAWATYYGGTSVDGAHAITSDPSNNIFVGGNTYSDNGISSPGSHQPVFGGSMDGFLIKFTPNGIREWATYLGGSDFGDQINALTCDASGNIYFSGFTGSTNNIATPGAYQDTLNGVDFYTGDAMVGEFTTSGKLVWCSYLSGPGQDRAHAIGLGKNSDLYIQGTAESTSEFATPGAYQTTHAGGGQDGFCAKWDTNGNFFWCSYYGGNDEEHGRGLKTDSSGNAYVSGWTSSPTGLGTPGSFQEFWYPGYGADSSHLRDAYLLKFQPDGSLAWGTYYGGEGIDRGEGLVTDKKADIIYLYGSTKSFNNVATTGLFQPAFQPQDGFVAKFKSDGTRVWSYYVGGTGTQLIRDAEVDNNQFLYFYMITDSPFYTSSGVYQPTTNGHKETVLIKLNPSDSCYDNNEPNDSKLTPKTISVSSETSFYGYTGVIGDAGDVDWFRIKILNTNLKIELTDLADDYDLFLYKENPAQLVKSSTNAGTSDETIIVNNIPKNKYLIRVKHNGSVFEPNFCYRLRPLVSSTPWPLKMGNEMSISGDDLQVHLYPNPVSDHLNLKITANEPGKLFMKWYNLMDQLTWSTNVMIGEGTETISTNVRDLPSGVYLLHLEVGGKKVIQKVIKTDAF